MYATPATAIPLVTSNGFWGGNETYGDASLVAKIQDTGYMKSNQRQLWANAKLTQNLDFWVKGLKAEIGIYRMIGTVNQGCLNADYRVACKRSRKNAFLNSLFNCREEVLRYGTAEYLLFENIRLLQIAGGLSYLILLRL